MTEEARDKAVEEAHTWLWRYCTHRPSGSVKVCCEDCSYDVLHLLWQRAQEAEREECTKAMCDQCARGLPLTPDGEHHYECIGGCGESDGPHGYELSCAATQIRNRSAARAFEEGKHPPGGHHDQQAGWK